MNRSRAYRRFQQKKRIRKARLIVKQWKKYGSNIPDDHFDKDSNHLAKCSCHMCGNPRKHFKEITLNEKRIALSEREEISDLIEEGIAVYG